MKSFEECCEECQEHNPFFKVGGSLVGKFAYTRETPFIQPFESIESPWADYIKSDSMETNVKKLFKLAQKYATGNVVPRTPPLEGKGSKNRRFSEEKPKPKEQEQEQEQEPEAEETVEDPDESDSVFEALKALWKQECDKGKQKDKNIILVIASKLDVKTEKDKDYVKVDRNLMKKLNKIFKTNYGL